MARKRRVKSSVLYSHYPEAPQKVPRRFMQIHSTEQLEAVFLFHGDHIAREMLYSEFGAILDGFVPVTEYAGGLAKAVYVRVNPGLTISAAVFFILAFDARGIIDRRWNVPLHQLADSAPRGPDLGAGPIRLACFSQCPIEWQRRNLWDPQMQPGCNSFVLMRKALQRNRLGLVFRTPAPEPAAEGARSLARMQEQQQQHKKIEKKLHERYSQELRNRLAQIIKEQRLRIATLVNTQKAKIQALQQEHQQRLHHYRLQLQQQQQNNQELEENVGQLKKNLLLQEQKIEGVREYFTHKLQVAQSGESNEMQTLQENFALEVEARVRAATAELQEMLDLREVELFYRHQQESNLKEEITLLRQENKTLINKGSDQLLQKLDKAGINFVTFHPGAGHMTIARDDIARYLNNPQLFAAEYCGVSVALYGAWLNHYHAPTCTAIAQSGEVCCKPVTRVDSPSEFHAGESDRCAEHRLMTPQRVAECR